MNTDNSALSRSWGLDLVRVLSMLGIAGLHVYNQGGALDAASGSPPNMIASEIIAVACYCSVNVFGLLTGWLYIERKNVKMHSLTRLMLTMFGWSAAITAAAFLMCPSAFFNHPKQLLIGVFPPFAGEYWYVTCYTFCFLMIPYINAMVHALTPERYRKLLLTLFLLLSVISTVGLKDYFKISRGYHSLWLIFCYLLGGYMRLHPSDFEKLTPRTSLIAFAVNVLIVSTADLAGKKFGISESELLYNYNSPFMVANAVFLMRIFSQITIHSPRMQKILRLLSSAAFSVYIIHTHPLIFHYPLKGMFKWTTQGGLLLCILGPISGMIGIYAVCTLAYMLCTAAAFLFKRISGGAK